MRLTFRISTAFGLVGFEARCSAIELAARGARRRRMPPPEAYRVPRTAAEEVWALAAASPGSTFGPGTRLQRLVAASPGSTARTGDAVFALCFR